MLIIQKKIKYLVLYLHVVRKSLAYESTYGAILVLSLGNIEHSLIFSECVRLIVNLSKPVLCLSAYS